VKQRLQRAGELERRAASASPPSFNTHLEFSPETRNRSLSTGVAANSNLVPQPHIPVFQELFPEQYVAQQEYQYPASSEARLKQPVTSPPMPFSYPGYAQPAVDAYTGFPQNASYTDFAVVPMPYSSPMTTGHCYTINASPMTTSSGLPATPITPTSQGDCYPADNRPPYGIDYTPIYDNQQTPTSQAFSDSATPVNYPNFFPQNYPS
jgi:hypothetical protein